MYPQISYFCAPLAFPYATTVQTSARLNFFDLHILHPFSQLQHKSIVNWPSKDINVRCSVHTKPEEVENAALFLRLGLPSTIIRHENATPRKRSTSRKKLKTLDMFDMFSCGRETL